MNTRSIITIIAAVSFTSCATPVVMTKQAQAAITPERAIGELQEGNARFAAGKSRHRNFVAQYGKTAGGQYPFAAVLGCIDSRCSNEIVFDQGIGDIFSARVAGNVLNDDILGSLEFATAKAGAKAIIVLGHTRCGAVNGACNDAKLGHVTGLLEKIKPVVRKVSRSGHSVNKGQAFEDLVAAENVKHVVSQIRARSSIVRGLESKGALTVRGAIYHLETGKVEFLR